MPNDPLSILLRGLQPVLSPDIVAFCALPIGQEAAAASCIGLFREAEGMTIIVYEQEALKHGWTILFRAAWLTLTVESDLADVGLTAAVATALAAEGISCNVVAAIHHDHLFVPAHLGETALGTLLGLQRSGR